ncbi:MAG: hypothetical protein ACRC8S_18840 [Fimbriiglobus sp.]
MTEFDSWHLALLAAHRMAVGDPRPCYHHENRPLVTVWPYRQDGVCRGGIDTAPLEEVPPGVRPLTVPADRVEDVRRAMKWPADRPVYVLLEPRLRIWAQDDQWFVDDSSQSPGGPWRRSFVWSFGTFTDAVAAIVRQLGSKYSDAPGATADGGG